MSGQGPIQNNPEKVVPEKNIPDWDRPDLVLENSSTPRLHDFTTPELHESTAMLLRYSMLPCLGVLSGHDLSTGGPGDPSSVGIHGSQSAKVGWATTGGRPPMMGPRDLPCSGHTHSGLLGTEAWSSGVA